MEPKITDFNFEEEYAEEVIDQFLKTNWPKPNHRWRLVYEVYNQSIEDLYFRSIDYLKEECKFPFFDKITDIFAASEQSAFFGVSQQRLGLQQDKVSQFLATIGKMVKELFQLVRELRILDERLEIYLASIDSKDQAAEITLKGYWIDLVEGGAKNPASVYGMAREIGFTTLPDLFFAAPVMEPEAVHDYVNKLEFNRKLKEVLSRKLKSFTVWKKHTFRELGDRRIFTIKYLRQHYDIIKMYMSWIKPYLRNIRRLHMDQKKMDTAHLIGAFEGSMIEIEVLAKKPFKDKVHGIVSLHFEYRSRPEMKFQQEGYQRGPLHVGRTTLTARSYIWTNEDLQRYKRFRAREDFALLATIDESVKSAYTALGDELERYLREAEETIEEGEFPHREKEKVKRPGLFDPFVSIFKGSKRTFTHKKEKPECPKCKTKNKPGALECSECGTRLRKMTRKEAFEVEVAKEKAKSHVDKYMYVFIKRFKAAYGFIY